VSSEEMINSISIKRVVSLLGNDYSSVETILTSFGGQ
jgi:hypothetical protein